MKNKTGYYVAMNNGRRNGVDCDETGFHLWIEVVEGPYDNHEYAEKRKEELQKWYNGELLRTAYWPQELRPPMQNAYLITTDDMLEQCREVGMRVINDPKYW